MALLKDLIVTGASKFIGDAYFNLIKSGTWNGTAIDLAHGGTAGTTDANKLLLSTNTNGTSKWSDWSTAGFLKTSNIGVISVDTTVLTTASNLDPSKLSSAVGVTKGGTGLNSISLYSLLYASAANTLTTVTPNTTNDKGKALAFNSSGNGYTWINALKNPNSLTFSTAGNGDTNGTAYDGSSAKTISYNSVIPALGVKFLELNFFTINGTSGGNSANLFACAAGTSTIKLNPRFRIVDPTGAYCTDLLTKIAANDSDYGLTFSNHASITADSGKVWGGPSSNYYYFSANTTTTSSFDGLTCTLPSETSKRNKVSYNSVINVKYGGAVKTFTITATFYRPAFVVSYSGVPDSTFLGTLCAKTSNGSFTYNEETCTYKILSSFSSTTNVGVKIDSTKQLRLWVVVPWSSKSDNTINAVEITFNSLKNSLGQSALDSAYSSGTAVNNETYGWFKLYATGALATNATPEVYINK